MTPKFAYRKDQLDLQGVHTAHNRWHELLEHDRKHSNITCRAKLDIGPRARERNVERNSTLDPKGLISSDSFPGKSNVSAHFWVISQYHKPE